MEAGKEWEPQLEDNLRKSSTLVALISSNSVKSDWVKHEGSIAYALNQAIIPVKIEPFEKYSANDLPLWASKIQLLDLIEGSPEYNDQFQKLKQILGEPLPIRQHLKEMLVHYKNSGMLLDEVALNLIERHYDELYLTKEEKVLADKLIEESKRKLEDYWVRYNKLQKDYENARKMIYALRNRLDSEIETLKEQIESMSQESKINEKVQFVFFIVIYIAIVVYVFSILMHFFF